MWISSDWKDYELLDCGGGERLERWGKYLLVRPDPQAIWRPEGGIPDGGGTTPGTSAPPPEGASGSRRNCPSAGHWVTRG